MSNIKNNNYKRIDCRLYNDNYMDFMLSGDNINDEDLSENCLASDISFSNINDIDDKIFSDVTWEEAVNGGETLSDIGLTGIDNGFISYRKDRITNEEFLNIFTNSKLDLSTLGNNFFVKKVNGNTLNYSYPIQVENNFVSLKGGFFQGFFKLNGFKYQTLPDILEDEWNFELKLRKRNDFEPENNTLNEKYPENKGIVFYIGTRAENKFWPLYKIDPKTEEHKNGPYSSDDYGNGFFNEPNNVTREEYQVVDEEAIENQGCYNCNCDCEEEQTPDTETNNDNTTKTEDCKRTYSKDILNTYDFDEHNHCGEPDCSQSEGYCGDECINTKYFDGGDYLGIEDGLAFDEEYISPDIKLDGLDLEDSEGHKHNKKGYFEIKTDNKFLIFDRTKDGFNANTWDDNNTFILTGRTDAPNINYYPLLHRGKDGKTINDIDDILSEHSYAYDIFKDIRNNCLAIQIKDNGSIGYKYGSFDCDSEYYFKINEEFSKENIIKDNEWTTVNIKIAKISSEVMKISIYVNAALVLVSKELPILNLKGLNDVIQKQEGVPYNISIGGGTQGLLESIQLDYYNQPDYTLPLEKYFAGTFIGDISKFRFFQCPLRFSDILNEAK